MRCPQNLTSVKLPDAAPDTQQEKSRASFALFDDPTDMQNLWTGQGKHPKNMVFLKNLSLMQNLSSCFIWLYIAFFLYAEKNI